MKKIIFKSVITTTFILLVAACGDIDSGKLIGTVVSLEKSNNSSEWDVTVNLGGVTQEIAVNGIKEIVPNHHRYHVAKPEVLEALDHSIEIQRPVVMTFVVQPGYLSDKRYIESAKIVE